MITGYIQTAGYDEKRTHSLLQHNFLRSVRVRGPQDHSVMISLKTLSSFQCDMHSISVYVEDEDSGKRLAYRMCTILIDVEVYSAHVFHIHWMMLTNVEPRYYGHKKSKGFRLRFSFHKVGFSLAPFPTLLRKLIFFFSFVEN